MMAASAIAANLPPCCCRGLSANLARCVSAAIACFACLIGEPPSPRRLRRPQAAHA